MAGLYIHIPFCASKCHYCNFYSTVSLKWKNEFVEALVKEMELRRDYLAGDEIESIYYGGGTPSLLPENDLEKIHSAIYKHLKISEQPEITIEANPDDLNREKAAFLKSAGFNRLSIGTQAFDDDILSKLNRRHSARQSFTAIENAVAAGFDNIGIDFIFGIPGLSDELLEKETDLVTKLNISHISAYHLTVEPKTALEVMIRKGKYPVPDEEQGARQFYLLSQRLSQAGFEHYEISNYARGGRYSLHNSNYWRLKKYLGLGPSAHSFDFESRQWNVCSVKSYCQNIFTGKPYFEKENLSLNDKFNEYVMLSLRTNRGVDLTYINKVFGAEFSTLFAEKAAGKIAQGQMEVKEGRYLLSFKGMFFADGIAADFFVD